MAKIEPHFETIFEGLLRLVNAFFGSLKNAIFWAPYLSTFAAYLGFSSKKKMKMTQKIKKVAEFVLDENGRFELDEHGNKIET